MNNNTSHVIVTLNWVLTSAHVQNVPLERYITGILHFSWNGADESSSLCGPGRAALAYMLHQGLAAFCQTIRKRKMHLNTEGRYRHRRVCSRSAWSAAASRFKTSLEIRPMTSEWWRASISAVEHRAARLLVALSPSGSILKPPPSSLSSFFLLLSSSAQIPLCRIKIFRMKFGFRVPFPLPGEKDLG